MDNILRKVCEMVQFQKLYTHLENSVSFIVQDKRDVFVNLPTRFGKSVVFWPLLVVFIISSIVVRILLSIPFLF